MYKQVVKKNWWNFENREIEDIFARGARTSNTMAKVMLPLDSTRQNGLETTLIDFLMEG